MPLFPNDMWDSLRDFILTSERKQNKLTNPIIDSWIEWHREDSHGLINIPWTHDVFRTFRKRNG